MWDLFENRHLFTAQSPTGERSRLYPLAQMHAILGPPPLDYLQRTKTSWEYFEDDGTRKGLTPIPDLSLQSSERRPLGTTRLVFWTSSAKCCCGTWRRGPQRRSCSRMPGSTIDYRLQDEPNQCTRCAIRALSLLRRLRGPMGATNSALAA